MEKTFAQCDVSEVEVVVVMHTLSALRLQCHTAVSFFMFQAKFLPHTGDCHIVTCARDGQVRLAQLSTTGTCKATKRLAAHKMAAHKVYCSAAKIK